MNMIPVSSSDIASVGYEAAYSKLYVQFHSGGLYSYDGVPKSVYDSLMAAGSHGSYFAQNIKNSYPYRRIS